MSTVEFEDQNNNQVNRVYQKQKTDHLSGFLIKYHLVRSRHTALWVLVAVSMIFIAGSVIILYKNTSSSHLVPFKDLPKDIQSKFPLPVQRLYEQKS